MSDTVGEFAGPGWVGLGPRAEAASQSGMRAASNRIVPLRASIADPSRAARRIRRQYQTYLKVHGRWCYLYRAIDRNGNLVDVLFSEHRDMKAAQAFFRSAQAVTGITPDRVTTDGHDSYPRAIRTELGKGVRHRTSAYLNNRLEQDHRGIK